MSWFEWLGMIGSIASIAGIVITAIPYCVFIIKKIRCEIIYHKLLRMNAMQLQNFFYKSNKNKRQFIKKQNSKLEKKIEKVEEGRLNKATLNNCVINMVESQENIEKEVE